MAYPIYHATSRRVWAHSLFDRKKVGIYMCDLARSIFNQYSGVIMGTMASEIISLTVVYSTVYSGADQRKHKSSATLVFVGAVHRWPVNSPHKRPVTRKMFRFGEVIIHIINRTLGTGWWKLSDYLHIIPKSIEKNTASLSRTKTM